MNKYKRHLKLKLKIKLKLNKGSKICRESVEKKIII